MPVNWKSWVRIGLEVGAVAVAVIMLVLMAQRLEGSRGYMLPNGQPMFGDYIAFWCAGDMANHGEALVVHSDPETRACQNRVNPEIRRFAPYNSPPTFLLFDSLLARIPYGPSAMLWLALTGAIYLFAAWKLLPDKRALIFAITLPAAMYHPGSVQTGLYIAGVSGLALYFLDRRPIAAGLLVALLAIKPHLAILWPLFFALSGRWRAFAAAAAGTLAFAAVAGFVWGWETWPNWLESLDRSAGLIINRLVGTQTYGSLFGNLLGLHWSVTAAAVTHAISALAALGVACWVFWKSRDWRTSGIALSAATLLMSPYLFFYDSALLALGGALLAPPRNKLEVVALFAAWGAALSVAIGPYISLPIVPACAWLVLICALRRSGNAAPAPAQARHT
ncbi:glycosyltransferase family 87 protein [Terricaulis sp.]|uniref:glycosyltransferase family 87 protein n=1 Tax=Terricaulis sp. TaxID=2768686 RepID=UPI00378330BF